MSFAFPIALTLAALALPIIAFYILKVRLRRVLVSTNLFWKQIYEEKPPRSIWQSFRHLLSLLLQLLMLLLLVLAIADPFFSGQLLQARRLVIVIDNSASMRATDISPSRLGAARNAALKIVDGLRLPDEVAVVLAGSTPEVVVGMTGHVPTLRDAIIGIPYSDNPTSLVPAIELGRQLIGRHPHGQVIVMTDGAVDADELPGKESEEEEGGSEVNGKETATTRSNATDFPRDALDIIASESPSPVEYRLFATEAANVGITQLQVRRSLNDPLGYEILASVKNASPAAVSCRLELSLDDIPVDVVPLDLKPEELWSRSFEKTSLTGGSLHGVLTQIRAGDSGASNGVSGAGKDLDLLSVDNSAWAILPGRQTQRVLIVSSGNLFLQKVFEASPLVEVTMRKDFPEQWPADSVIVLHGQVPATLPSGSVFVVDPAGNCDLWEQGETLENPIVTEQDELSPLMNHIRLDNVMMPEAKQLHFKTAPHSLAKTLSGDPVYAEVKRPNGKCLVLSLNLDRSDLAFRTAFPILVANSLGWFSGNSGEFQPSLSTGSLTTLTIEKDSKEPREVFLLSPSQKMSKVPMIHDVSQPAASELTPASENATASDVALLALGPVNEIGVWSVVRHAAVAKGQVASAAESSAEVLASIAVNLAAERETNLRPLKDVVESAQAATLSAGWFSRPLWYYLVILACVLTSLEWFLYQRRLIS